MAVAAPQFPGVALLMGKARACHDLHRGHADGVRHAQVLFEIVEHDGAPWVHAMGGEKIGIGGLERLGLVFGGLDVEDTLEQPARSQPVEHGLGMGSAAIGEDELAPRQRGDRFDQFGMSQNGGIVDGVNVGQIVLGIDSEGLHQTVQRRAVVAVIGFLHLPRRVEIEPCDAHHILGDQRIDLGEQIAFTRIERVVEIENPIGNVIETRGRWGHVVHDPIMPQIDEWEMTFSGCRLLAHHQRSRAVFGEEFEQHRVRGFAVDDHHALNAPVERFDAGFHLGDHAARYRAVGD